MTPQMELVAARRREAVTRVKQTLIDGLELDLAPSEIAEDSALFGFGLGLDSIDALTLIVAVEDSFGVRIPDDDLRVLRSTNTIVDFVLGQAEDAAG